MRRSHLIVLLLWAPLALAQDARSIRKVDDLNRTGMEDFDLLEFDAAKKKLTDALALVKKARLDKHPVAARTHRNLAVVYASGLNDNDTALVELVAALQIDPSVAIDAAYRTPALTKLYEQAKAGATGKPPEPPPEPEAIGIQHTPIEEAPGGDAILVTAKVGPELRQYAIKLFYRPAGSETFTPTMMKSAGGAEYQGVIPASATTGVNVHYYIEARNAAGKVVAAAASSGSPNVISILRPKKAPSGDDDENPLSHKNDDGTTVDTQAPGAGKKTLFIGVAVGSGGGFVNGQTEVSQQDVTCCFAVAPLHILAEVGFWLDPTLSISLLARIGIPLGANVDGAATAAPAAFVRVTKGLGRGPSGFYLHGDVGGGFIRYIIKLRRTSTGGIEGDTDTIATGPLFLGGGAGWRKALGGPASFFIDLNVEVGIPIIKEIGGGNGSAPIKPGFAVNADLSLGVAFSF
jgi:hypothetical protein